MGGVVDAIFGGGDNETEVTYQYPPEATVAINRLVELSRQLEQMQPSLIPELSNIYRTLYNLMAGIPQALESATRSFADTLGGIKSTYEQQLSDYIENLPTQIQTTERERASQLESLYDTTIEQIRSEVSRVKDDLLQNLYRDLSVQGLISSKAMTDAISETFRQYELEPVLSNIQAKEKALTGLYNTTTSMLYDYFSRLPQYYSSMAEFGKEIETLRSSSMIDYINQLPQLYSTLAEIQSKQAMLPWSLTKEIMGAITGIGQLAGQLATPIVSQPQPGLLQQALPIAAGFGIAKLLGKLF